VSGPPQVPARRKPLPFRAIAGCYKKQIDHPTNPARNHPIHDEVEIIEYGAGRWIIGIALDGVSETKSQKRLVPIGRMLCWDFARFCKESQPEEMQAMVDWFRASTRKPELANQGATTISLIRFDKASGTVDGLNIGDSVPLMVVERLDSGIGGHRSHPRRGAVLAPLHSVSNEPSSVYKCWRHERPFEPDGFRLKLPKDFTAVWLITMSDGFGKITDKIAGQLIDHRRVERILAKRYPDFVRVFLPEVLAPLAPGVKRPKRGRVRYSAIRHNLPLKEAFTGYYQDCKDQAERQEMETVDLDTMHLATLVNSRAQPNRKLLERTVGEYLDEYHRTLGWLARAPFNPRVDDEGIEAHLRQYVLAELFAEAMVTYLSAHLEDEAPSGGTEAGQLSLTSRLRRFVDGLGQIGDDFCAAVIRVSGLR
jgi:hypothetical protein